MLIEEVLYEEINCKNKSKCGDNIKMDHRGTGRHEDGGYLAVDFDSSYIELLIWSVSLVQ